MAHYVCWLKAITINNGKAFYTTSHKLFAYVTSQRTSTNNSNFFVRQCNDVAYCRIQKFEIGALNTYRNDLLYLTL
ncbi:hypothetical protein SDC9_178401 [bioreactor metagenome]|uniref:Uncharacterized protein n=1 Tax=bioreactor metagenome TaxID=1076179 RepID=A0A645GX40_9ZZZZ